jgi:hypothetical protein
MGKSIKLNIVPEFNFQLIALVTSEPIYRVSWLLNENLDIQLKEAPPLQTYHNKIQVVQEFSVFQFVDEDESVMQLIQNKSQHGYLIEEQKQVDFWLKTEDSKFAEPDLVRKIKSIKNINLAFEVKPGSLKSKNRLFLIGEQI